MELRNRWRRCISGLVITTLPLGACGSDTDEGAAANSAVPPTTEAPAPSTTETVPTSSTASGDTNQTTHAPTATSTVPIEAAVTEFVSPEGEFTVHVPPGFEPLGDPRAEGDGKSRLVSVAFADGGEAPRLIVTMTRGADSATQLSLEGVDDPVERETVSGLRPEGDVYRWTDSLTQQRGVAWAADPVTVIWVYASNLSDDVVTEVVRSIEVAPS